MKRGWPLRVAALLSILLTGCGGGGARSVGTTGTMVQVIDPPYAPWIADYSQLFTAKPWTGRLLIPLDPWPVRYAIPLLMSAAGLILFAVAVRRGMRSRHHLVAGSLAPR